MHRGRRRRVWRGRGRWWLVVCLLPLAGLGWLAAKPRARPAGPAAPSSSAAGPPPVRAYDPEAALTAIDSLPDLAPGVLAGQWSSVDPAGRNDDGSPANVLYHAADGASVVFDATGPGVVDDIWVAGSLAAMGDIRIRVDGAATPAVDMPAAEFFSGTRAPFLSPLVGDAAASSGGNYSYVPIAFQRSCVIAFTGRTAYWHVGYRRLPAGTPVAPFSPRLDVAKAVTLWSHAGVDPHQAAGTRQAEGVTAVPAGGAVTLARLAGPGRIESLRLAIPAAAVPPPASQSVSTLAFSGPSSFEVRVNPANAGVTLVRGFDYALADQTARVYVDGAAAGEFSSPGSTNGPYFLRDASVTLPARLTAGRSRIRVTVVPSTPFTAFSYRAYSDLKSGRAETDSLPMTPAAQASHAFTAQGVLWRRTVTSAYLPRAVQSSRTVLGQLHLQIRFDGAAAPAVDAPLGLFFGTGEGAATVRSLLFSVDPATGALASYWPMPFAREATVVLVNRGATAVSGIGYTIADRPDPADGTALSAGREGYFHATYESAAATIPGRDYGLLTAGGTGRLVGVSMALQTPPNMPYGLRNLQGNAVIFLNGNPSPAYVGTGTEDLFQGGYYFEGGPFALPTHGSPAEWVGPDYAAHTAAYRLFVSDAIPFYDGVRAAIQVGPMGNLSADYGSVAFWYGLPGATLAAGDALAPASPAAAAAHAWQAVGARTIGPRTGLWAGVPGAGASTATGVAVERASFTVELPAANAGAVLRARIDQCPGHQAARVYVDGTFVGVWSEPAGNCLQIWRESRFLLPAALTRGRGRLTLALVAVPGPGAPPSASAPLWTAFGYQALAFTSNGAPGGTAPGAPAAG